MTFFILAITAAISILAFNNRELFNKLQFNPYQVYHRKQWYRLISHGFVHGGWLHLIINMLVFWSFGISVQRIFDVLALEGIIRFPVLNFGILYFGGIVIASLSSLRKHRDNSYYNSVGASGAVSAVVFVSIFFDPWHKIYFYGIIGIPGIILGIGYLIYSYIMSKKSSDHINHDAHFLGAVWGFIYPLILDYNLFKVFISKLVT
jgi:membrane associated rhomboid family serine protease